MGGTAATNGIPVKSVFTCPDDANNFSVAGGLSYVANAGYINSSSCQNHPVDDDAAGTRPRDRCRTIRH